MSSWFKRIWNDEDAFKAALRVAMRMVGGLVGAGLSTGLIAPAVVGDSGWKIGLFLMATAAGFPSRAVDPKEQEPATPELPPQPKQDVIPPSTPPLTKP